MADLRTPELEDLIQVIARIDDPDALYALFEDIFTIREMRESSQRLQVARMLNDGKSYSEIEKATGVSATTIARVSKCLSYGAGGYEVALKVLDDMDAKEGEQR